MVLKPKYLIIAETLKQRIQNGTYLPGTPFPQQSKLAQEFQTSRVTVRKAIEQLIKIGLVYTQRGAGTFVRTTALKTSHFDRAVDQYIGTTKLVGDQSRVSSQIIQFQIRYPNAEERQLLNLTPHEMVYDIQRQRLVDGEPYALEYTKMPVKTVPGIDETVLKASVYHYIETTLHQKIGAAYRKISAAKATEADQQYLACQKFDPILRLRQVVFLENNVPFELSETHHRYDKEQITVYLPGHTK